MLTFKLSQAKYNEVLLLQVWLWSREEVRHNPRKYLQDDAEWHLRH